MLRKWWSIGRRRDGAVTEDVDDLEAFVNGPDRARQVIVSCFEVSSPMSLTASLSRRDRSPGDSKVGNSIEEREKPVSANTRKIR
jgi:hypothetical protein